MQVSRSILPTAALAALLLASCSDGGAAESRTGAAEGCEPEVAADALVEPGTLTYSINATLPPVQYVENGEIVGMRVELVNEIAARLCLDPKPMNVPFDAQIPGVQGDRWDMINTGMFYTEERAETLTLVPYEVQAVAISTVKGNEQNLSSVEDLAGKKIGVEAPGYEFDSINAVNEDLVSQGMEPITINTSLTNADAFQALSAGQLDGVVTIEAVTTFYQSDGRFTTALEGLSPGPLAFGFKKENTDLADAVASAYAEMAEDGFVEKLFEEYAVTPFPGPFEVTTGPLTLDGNK